MAQEIKIAKLLTRTGLKSSLPQPLSPGEFGTALDTKEVFIGLNPTNTSANNALPIINCYASVVDAQTYANQLINTYLFQVNLTDPGIDDATIDSANDDNVTAGFTRRYIKIAGRLYISYEYKYTASVLDVPVLPNTGLGTEALLSAATGTSFVNNTFDLSLLGTYTWQDTSAIASLINFAFTPSSGIKSGLVNVEQNLRVLTEADLVSMQTDNIPVISINGIKNLQSLVNRIQYITGFYENGTTGSGHFLWSPSTDKALHNGGTIIAPEAVDAWDGTQSDIATLLNWTGTGTGCWVRQFDTLMPQYYGAIADGIVDDTLPIVQSIKTASIGLPGFSSDGDPTGAIYFPTGIYRITETGVFSRYVDVKRNGIKCTGDGPENTIVWLDPSALVGTGWFYDNGPTVRAWNATFEHMSFHGGITWRTLGGTYSNFDSSVNGFRFTGPSWESGHVFINCTFAWLDTILSADGTNNADTIRFSMCTAIKCRRGNYINNLQSVNITWHQCYLSNHFGDFVEWGTGIFGGGNFAFSNGTIVFTPDTFGAGQSKIFNIVNGGTATSNAPVSFTNSRFEIKGNGSTIGAVSAGSTMVSFKDCSFLSTDTIGRTIATVGGYCSLTFKDCSFAPQGNAVCNWEVQSTVRTAKQASIKFLDCNLSKWDTLHTLTFSGNRGYIELDGCWEEFVDYPDDPSPMVRAINGVYKGTGKDQNTGYRQSKTYVIDPLRGGLLPFTNANEALVSLPRGSVLCGAFIVLQPATSGATPSQYRVLIGKPDKSVIYAASTVGAQNAGFVLDVRFAVPMGTALADRTVMIWADDGAGGTSGAGAPAAAISLLEYY